MNRSEDIGQLATALASAQGEIKSAEKSNLIVTEKQKRTYADLASIWNACREPLSKNGLAIVQTLDHEDTQMSLVTTLLHKSGEYISSTIRFTPAANQTMNYMQAMGSSITYARKYALMALVGVAPDDDDDATTATAQAAAQKTNGKTPRDPEAEARERGLIISNTERWLADHGIAATRDARLFVASRLLRKPVLTYNDISAQEAAQVLNLLDNLAAEFVDSLRSKFPTVVSIDEAEAESNPFDEIDAETTPTAQVGPGH